MNHFRLFDVEYKRARAPNRDSFICGENKTLKTHLHVRGYVWVTYKKEQELLRIIKAMIERYPISFKHNLHM